jgi:Tfp pilus assembly PilM family ATPase
MGLESFKNFGAFAGFGQKLSRSVSGPMGIPVGIGLPIAVDFGIGSLKIIQVEAGEPPKLVAASCLDTPDELLNDHAARLEFQFKALPKLIRQGGFKGKRAVCTIPAWQTACKCLQFQKSDGVPVAELVKAALPAQMGVSADSIVYRFIEVSNPTQPGKAEVIVLAAARDQVEHLMSGLVNAKLEPVGMQTEFLAAVRAFDHITKRDGDVNVTTLYLDMGSGSTKVMIAHGRQLAFARLIDVGGRHLDEIAASQLDCGLAEARKQRLSMELAAKAEPVAVGAGTAANAAYKAVPADRRTGDSKTPPGFGGNLLEQDPVHVAPEPVCLDEPLEILIDEVQVCLRYHASQFPGRKIDRAVFVGGESRHRGLCQHIARGLRLPAQTADPLAWIARTGLEPAIGVDMKQPQPGWAVPIGLCLSPTDL